MTDKNDHIDEAIERLISALWLVLEWNGRSPEATLHQIRQVARATLTEVQELLTANSKS